MYICNENVRFFIVKVLVNRLELAGKPAPLFYTYAKTFTTCLPYSIALFATGHRRYAGSDSPLAGANARQQASLHACSSPP